MVGVVTDAQCPTRRLGLALVRCARTDITIASGNEDTSAASNTVHTISAYSIRIRDCNYNNDACSNTIIRAVNINERTIQVAPNPVINDQFQLHLDQVGTGDASWQILSMTGQVMQEKQLELTSSHYQENIAIGTLARGTYLLRWRDQQGEQTVRFAVQ